MSLLSRLKTPVLQNTGSTARDHLASERTFLAWLRTGLGFVALGIAIERFSQLDVQQLLKQNANVGNENGRLRVKASEAKNNTPKDKEQLLVATLLGTGIGAVTYGSVRYFGNLKLLQRGLYKPAYYGAAGMGLAVAGLAAGAYVATLKEEVRRETT